MTIVGDGRRGEQGREKGEGGNIVAVSAFGGDTRGTESQEIK